jgi:hypothetical protein
MSAKMHMGVLAALGVAMCGAVSGAWANAPTPPPATVNTTVLQSQASNLFLQFRQNIMTSEASSLQKNLAPADKQAAIQTMLQNTITQSGADPRAVLAALKALEICSAGGTGYLGDGISLVCNLKDSTLSKEALNALANLERTVAALLDTNPAPAAIGGNGGTSPLGAPPTGTGGGGSTDYRV